MSVLLMRKTLLNWYKRRAPCQAKLTQVNDFTIQMVATRQRHHLKMNGAECWGVVFL